jgi:gamma-glutamyltranspeptidase/glutathione hydrolase
MAIGWLRRACWVTAWATAGLCWAQSPDASPVPEGASQRIERTEVRFGRRGVVSAHGLATRAGYWALQQGGNAVDAAIATQWALSVVEPQSSGLGGGGFAVVWAQGRAWALDGREAAPSAATPELFLERGRPMGFEQARASPLSVGVPGQVALLYAMHERWGRLPWAQLLEPAIGLAESGFAVGPRLHGLLESDPLLRQDPQARQLFYRDDGSAVPVGALVRNPELAWLLNEIARQGPAAMSHGPVAQAVLRRIEAGSTGGSRMTLHDLQSYRVRVFDALCFKWVAWPEAQVCGMPPPSSGTLAVGQMLGMLESATDRLGHAAQGAAWAHAQSEAARLAFADRAAWVGDPGTVSPPAGDWRSLLEPAYLQQRSTLLGPTRMSRAPAGQPAGAPLSWGAMAEQAEFGTTHLNTVDEQGMAVAMTSSIESAFGSRRMVNTGQGRLGGFLLNHELTDFALTPRDASGQMLANAPGSGKRPRSSMTPLLVLRPGPRGKQVQMALGSAGGPFIIHHVAQSLWAMVRWGHGPQQASAMPRWGITDPMGPIWLEADSEAARWADALSALGHPVRVRELSSGLHVLARDADGHWRAGVDPRREGLAQGD